MGDPSHQEWTAAQVQDRLNEAQEAFALDTQAFERISSASVTAGDSSYGIGASGLITIRRVVLNGKDLVKTSEAELDRVYADDWSLHEGAPSHYFITNTLGTGGNREINLYPQPTATDAGTDNLVLTFVQVPDVMSSDSSNPFTYSGTNNPLFDPYHIALAYYAAETLLVVRPTQERLVTAQQCRAKYEQAVSKCVDYLRGMIHSLRMRGGRYY